jgi:hypothetical protein
MMARVKTPPAARAWPAVVRPTGMMARVKTPPAARAWPAVVRPTGMMARVKTIQLRRYTLIDGEYDAFLEWFDGSMPRVRPEAGFTIEFAYGLRETNEFVWAVSADGDRDRFLELEQAYMASDARAAAFAGVPQRIAVYNIAFVDDIAIG